MVKQSTAVKLTFEKDLLKKAQKSISSVLSEVPFVELKGVKASVRIDNKEVDIILNLLVSGKPTKFIVEVKSQGEPRYIRMASAQIKDYLQNFKDTYGIIVAPYISDASRQICKEAGIGCADLAGNAFLSFNKVVISLNKIPGLGKSGILRIDLARST